MVSLLASFWCRKDTPGSFAVFSNSLASSDDILRFKVVASGLFEIGDVLRIWSWLSGGGFRVGDDLALDASLEIAVGFSLVRNSSLGAVTCWESWFSASC